MTIWWFAILLAALLAGAGFAYRTLQAKIEAVQQDSRNLEKLLTETQQELSEVKTRRKRLLAAATQALVVVEANYTISRSNKVARRLFGKPVKHETTLLEWINQPNLQHMVGQTFGGHRIDPIYFRHKGRDLEARARWIKRSGKIVAVALAIHDVTQLKRLSRARRDFVANISRELHTPVSAIQALTRTILAEGLHNQQATTRRVSEIVSETETLRQIVRELMDLSLIESGQMPLRLQPYSLKALVEAQFAQFTHQASRKNLDLSLDIPANLWVLADEKMVGRVLGNLIHNAIKFTETGHVSVSARAEPNGHDDSWVVINIADTGIGVDPDKINQIFDQFYKTGQHSSLRPGTGLGLTIAKRIIEAHGGQIWTEANQPTGSIFCFTLPLEANEE